MPAPEQPDHQQRFGLVDHLLGDSLLVIVILAWWAYSSRVPEYIFPTPLTVGKTLLSLVADPPMLMHTAASMVRVVTSVFTATVLGSALALLAYYLPVTREIVHGRIKPFLQSFPSIGWALLAIVWFKISNSAVIFVEVAVLIPFCLVNVSEGLRNIDLELLEMGHSFTRWNWRVFRWVIWPLLYPFVIAATRMAYGVGLKIALVAEVFGAKSGLGFLMYQAEEAADTPMVFGTCIAIVILFIIGDRLVFEPLSKLYRGSNVATAASRTA
jgi:NitT/TauT family transport system permease protein/sulfonate transport system permease protein